MKSRKPKSLGKLHWPSAELAEFDGGSGRAAVLLKDGPRTVRIEFDAYCGARTMTDLARKIVERQRAHALYELRVYEELRDYTGYKEPNGAK